MPLHEAIGFRGPLTHRQYEAWQAWLCKEWNEPDRHDHYLMLIAAEVKRVPAHVWGKAQPIKLSDHRIPFELKKVETEAEREVDERTERKRATALAKATSLARVGMLEEG